MWYNKENTSFKKGFGLVEMAIYISIVGALAASIVGGQAVLNNSRLNSVSTDFRQFTQATNEFIARYNAYPGDIPNIKNTFAAANNGPGTHQFNYNQAPSLYFWDHLKRAQLISGNYDQLTPVAGKGLPTSRIAGGGYSVSLNSNVISFKFAHYNASGQALSILSPEDARSIDITNDDGNPSTGSIQAIEGSDVTSGSCVVNATYNVANKNTACVVIMNFAPITPTIANSNTTCSDGSVEGATRLSTSQNCPSGFQGEIIETCQKNAQNQMEWDVTARNCRAISCGEGSVYNQTRNASCPTNYKGSIVEQCGAGGVWQIASSNCTLASQSCGTEGATKLAPCPLGKKGRHVLTCQNGIWNDMDNCTSLSCQGDTLGKVITSSSVNCPVGYQASSTGTVQEVCTWEEQYEINNSLCVPNSLGPCTYSSANSQTKILTCAPGSIGNYVQTCTSNNMWTITTYSCIPVGCGNNAVGTSRPSSNVSCPSNLGVVLEVCSYDAVKNNGFSNISTLNCVAPDCPADVTGTVGNATWPETSPGATANGTCITGYAGTATRNCNQTGNWDLPTASCVPEQCPELVDSDGTWPVTNINQTATLPCPSTGTSSSTSTGTSTSSPVMTRLCNAGAEGSAIGVWAATDKSQCQNFTCDPVTFSSTSGGKVCGTGRGCTPAQWNSENANSYVKGTLVFPSSIQGNVISFAGTGRLGKTMQDIVLVKDRGNQAMTSFGTVCGDSSRTLVQDVTEASTGSNPVPIFLTKQNGNYGIDFLSGSICGNAPPSYNCGFDGNAMNAGQKCNYLYNYNGSMYNNAYYTLDYDTPYVLLYQGKSRNPAHTTANSSVCTCEANVTTGRNGLSAVSFYWQTPCNEATPVVPVVPVIPVTPVTPVTPVIPSSPSKTPQCDPVSFSSSSGGPGNRINMGPTNAANESNYDTGILNFPSSMIGSSISFAGYGPHGPTSDVQNLVIVTDQGTNNVFGFETVCGGDESLVQDGTNANSTVNPVTIPLVKAGSSYGIVVNQGTICNNPPPGYTCPLDGGHCNYSYSFNNAQYTIGHLNPPSLGYQGASTNPVHNTPTSTMCTCEVVVNVGRTHSFPVSFYWNAPCQ